MGTFEKHPEKATSRTEICSSSSWNHFFENSSVGPCLIKVTMDNPSSFSEMLRPNENEGGYFNDYCNWQSIPEIKDFVQNSPAASIVGQLMKCKFRYNLLFVFT